MNNRNSEVVVHKVIRVKTDCPHFINVGNLCARVDGMARCDEYSECEFKYINALKEENERLEEEVNKLKKAIKEIKKGAVYGSVNSKHFLHNIFEEIIKICNESEVADEI